jgi:RNA polymerase sigma-70 factor (ECF subfamily)
MNDPSPARQDSGIQQLSALFSRYRRTLARAVARIVRPQDIEDIVQETYVRIYQAAQRQQIHHPKSFMLRTARTLALNHIGSADAMSHLASIDFNSDADEDMDVWRNAISESLESTAQTEEEFLMFCRSVCELPVQCRRVFVLRKVYGMSQQEVAKHLGISEATVEKHVAKGVITCGAYMKAIGYARGRTRDGNSRLVKKTARKQS